ncbi:UEV domain-containing protein [Ditylenchus destructor]|uniref:UEV domain-containing protein n=1 Tax=Ditylenchus destructor TaxID=166010 RepID=A0AAD4N6F1_9BILA|nr:UEV domain-containing protein [Ditylenchus destructor]
MYYPQANSRGPDALNDAVQRARMRFPQLAKQDIQQALATFTNLRPTVTNHAFPDGQTRLCCSLEGTIPVLYKGNTYNIPVALYLMDNHPYTGPFCYVRPTATMRVRVSDNVAEDGRIFLPYLTEWCYPNSNTHSLIQVMITVFQEKCPVYSIVTPSGNTNRSSNNPTPPYPTANPTPPYPAATAHHSMPYPSSANPTPYPPYPTNLPHTGSAGSLNSAGSSDIQHRAAAAGMGSNWPGYDTGTIQSSHIRASLISAVEDKIKNKLRDKIGTPFAELQSVNINLQELQTGQQKLRDMLEKMDQDQKKLDIALVTYTEKKAELGKALESCAGATSNGQPSIDDAIDANTPLHRQIVRCYAQDCAIDDTIYFLGQALRKDTINIQIYLKYVRQLSRKQFIHRATLQKCRQKARLPV